MVTTSLSNGHVGLANGTSVSNGKATLVNGTNGHDATSSGGLPPRAHPQESYSQTSIDPDSFYGKLRALYASKVLKTQLEQMKKQGSYDAFQGKWHPAYDVRPLKAGMTRLDGIPPSLFWESDVGKWIEAACYFLNSPDSAGNTHASEFEAAIQELVDMMEAFQKPDGYIGIYFSVVDPAGRMKNFRDMHELYNAGHLLEGALAHYHYTGSRQFLDIMLRNIAFWTKHLGRGESQIAAYGGHPEMELAVLRLYSTTRDPAHLEFGKYLISERGQRRKELDDLRYYDYEARQRDDLIYPHTMDSLEGIDYHQAHVPIHEQRDILGHSVRALYLTTACADLGGDYLEDAKRLWADCVDHKMYATGGIGTEPRLEGFSKYPYRLPQSSDEGGCYAETCASIAGMMTSERILSWGLDGGIRDTMELCLLNAVLGGGALNGTQFSYANKQATCEDETAIRKDWFEVCCCPPNLSRTLGMLGGYTWNASVDASAKTIKLDVYLFLSATRTIPLGNGQKAVVNMKSAMPLEGETKFTFEAPEGWKWEVNLPEPDYARDIKVSERTTSTHAGFLTAKLPAKAKLDMTFSLPVRLLASHPLTNADLLTVHRGPICYTAESVDNPTLDAAYPQFAGVGLDETTTFAVRTEEIQGIPVVMLESEQEVFAVEEVKSTRPFKEVGPGRPAVTWAKTGQTLRLVPWFARANKGGDGRVRTAFRRVTGKTV